MQQTKIRKWEIEWASTSNNLQWIAWTVEISTAENSKKKITQVQLFISPYTVEWAYFLLSSHAHSYVCFIPSVNWTLLAKEVEL